MVSIVECRTNRDTEAEIRIVHERSITGLGCAQLENNKLPSLHPSATTGFHTGFLGRKRLIDWVVT
jgi:hypothetical protein